MRSLRLVALLLPLALAGCPGSHGRMGEDDAGPGGDGGRCEGGGFLICVSDCGSDAGAPPICSGGRWVCPPGTRDLSTCPPTCHRPPPGPSCVCEGTEWRCETGICPEGINPWDPDAPGNACSPDGIECSSGTADACGGGMWCRCEAGHWNCAVAEPDPVCWCGRQPMEGDRCAEEGALCGECCPTAGGTGWPAMNCVDGHWTSAACPAIECPPIVPAGTCPVDPERLVGTSCSAEGQVCGHACCEGEIVCRGGRWERGAIADCAFCPETECGTGHCNPSQYCHQTCGPTDGPLFVCEPAPTGCSSCDCIPLWGTQSCEMEGGHPVVRDLGFCG